MSARRQRVELFRTAVCDPACGFLFPALVFATLYGIPFIDKLLTRDLSVHNVLRLPLNHPFSTSLGCAIFSFIAVLEIAGADDVAAVVTGSSVIALRAVLRIAVFVVPAFVGAAAFSFCLAFGRPVKKLEQVLLAEEGKPDHAHS